jgi:acyl-coenzyme A thioesterase PaaI-like protein
MTNTTPTYRLWKSLASRPGGSRVFSVATMVRVPYFASIVPHVRRMEPGFAEVSVPKWFYVHNHLGTVHAIASCNAAELAMGMLMEATVPTSHRWIPKSMTVAYLEKATTSLRAQARLDPPDSPRSPKVPRSSSQSASSTGREPRSCMPTSPPG